MNDFLFRGTIAKKVRFVFGRTTELCRTAMVTHQNSMVAGEILSRTLSASVLTSALLEGEERYSLKWKYEGKIGIIIVDLGAYSDIRAMFQPEEHVASEGRDSMYGVKEGVIGCIKATAKMQLSNSVVPAPHLDTAEDLAELFKSSDQIPTDFIVWLKYDASKPYKIVHAHSLMLQAMPDCMPSTFKKYQSLARGNHFPKEWMYREIESKDTVKQFIENLFQSERMVGDLIVPMPPPIYQCNCGKEAYREKLLRMGTQDLKEMAEEDEETVLVCHFCQSEYHFSKDEMISIVREKSS